MALGVPVASSGVLGVPPSGRVLPPELPFARDRRPVPAPIVAPAGWSGHQSSDGGSRRWPVGRGTRPADRDRPGKSRAAQVRSAGTEQPLTLGRPHPRQVGRPAARGPVVGRSAQDRSRHVDGADVAVEVGAPGRRRCGDRGGHQPPAATFQPVRTAASLKRVSWPLPAADDRATLGRPLRSRHQWGLPVRRQPEEPFFARSVEPMVIRRPGRAPTSLPGTRCPCAGPQHAGYAPAAQGRPAGGPVRPERFRSACAGGPGADGARATGRQGFSGEPGATARCRRPGHGG